MGMSSAGVRTTNLTINQASAELRTTAAVRAKVLELSLIQATGTAQSLGLGRPQAIGVTPGTSVTPTRDEPGDPASVCSLVTTWGTSPTVPLVFHRRWNSAATIGVGVVWTFPRGLMVPVSSSIVIWNITTAQAVDLNIAYDE